MAEAYDYWVTFEDLKRHNVPFDRATLAVPFLHGGRVDRISERVYLSGMKTALEAATFIAQRKIGGLTLYGMPKGSDAVVSLNQKMLDDTYPAWLAAMGQGPSVPCAEGVLDRKEYPAP